jgi:hypothetical protein
VTPSLLAAPTLAAILFAIAAAVVLLHLLRPRPQRQVLASTLLWGQILRGPRLPPARWRWWLSLALALAIALALGLAALARNLGGIGGQQRPLLVVVDSAPSMSARLADGETRWQRAIAHARALVQSAPVTRRVMVLDTMQRAPVAGALEPERALETLARLSPAAFGTPRMPRPAFDPAFEVHVFTDGVSLPSAPAHAVEHPVFEVAANVGIVAFEAHAVPGDPTRVEAFVQLFNAARAGTSVSLSIRGESGFAIAQQLELDARQSVDLTFDVSAHAGGVLGAAVSLADDAYAGDDLAFAFVPPHARKTILLFTRGNPPLQDALNALPGVEVTTLPPARYAHTSKADVHVFDRFAPRRRPAAPALLFDPPAVSWLAQEAGASAPADVSEWDATHPVMHGSRWELVRLQRASPLALPQGRALVTSAAGALVAASDTPPRLVRLGFALQDSNLARQAWFPVFLGNAIDWLSQMEVAVIHPLGAIEVPIRPASVHDGNGAPVPAVSTTHGTRFEAARPDIYTVRGEGRSVKVAVNSLEPRLSDINETRLAHIAGAAAPVSQPPRVGPEAGVWLLLAALLLLAVEWFAYMRRLTA